MKRTLILTTAAMFTLPLTAKADELDCFPMCTPKVEQKAPEVAPAVAPAADTVTGDKQTVETVVVTATPVCEKNLVAKAEELNDRVKPVKDIIGYVHSPQSLALKVVNDHIVKIPSWVGFALDPVGTVKNKAIDMARDKAKDAMGFNKAGGNAACKAEPAAEPAPEAVMEKAADAV